VREVRIAKTIVCKSSLPVTVQAGLRLRKAMSAGMPEPDTKLTIRGALAARYGPVSQTVAMATLLDPERRLRAPCRMSHQRAS
jgi:hypothetical protein